ncbi:MAG: bifunctional phosphoglucose/phosphomannose isomerase [Firmicutes bacterium]|mgnify:CR=1 FL=1|nr:bifunctional phosphoglucose/phosphomannose isomerase [Bacillota bacterium]HOB34235.1 bifunctional phosphoglucose/phosphomannose isomerase [Bacillota bacterium]HPZ89946.1 bifunctional phosphoglucose/phosphomannose isomerase [Bacillota bacterium]HQE01352.1 bifunctional phosphoglucose/phosphomannose isomerase [Bacillota bacterium]
MILNDPSALRRLDTLGSLAATEAYPEQFALGLQLAEKFDLPATYRRDYHEILVLGTGGGSSITGALLTSLFFHRLQQPVIISQGYNIPAFADANTLTVALSHSGNTEEILSAVEQARQRGCPVMAITAGGALGEICRTHGIPHLIVPRDIGHPRRNLGYLVPPLVLALARLGLVPDISADIREAMALMEELRDQYGVDVPLERNPAKQLAARLRGHIPLIYGSSDHLQAPAWRWKNQFGENSKLLAFYNLVPHLHHDEAVGWDMEPELLQKFFLIMLRDDQLDTPKVSKRKEITVEMLRERLGGVEEVWAQGQSVFARLFSLIYLGDFVSLYAAAVRGIDPTPVAIINLFKEKMGQ